MTQFINFKYKTNNFDDIMTQFIKINDTVFSIFKYKNGTIYKNQ